MKRRVFLQTAAASVAAPILIPHHALAAPGQPGANDRIRAAVIGTGGRVSAILGELPKDIQVVALADCDLRKMGAGSVFGKRMSNLFPTEFPRWPRYQDYRRMFDNEKLDAVFVTTPTHARALICVHAVQAGLDVYAEKPLTLTIEEGQVLVKATRKHQRVLQVGTQCRSLELYTWVNNLIRGGRLGKLEKVVAHSFVGPKDPPAKPGEPVPKGLDWDKWCNQAPLVPFSPAWFNWSPWRPYDGGGSSWGVTGWGTHAYDMVQAALGADGTGPVEVWPTKAGDPMSPVTMLYASGIPLELSLPVGHANFWGSIYHGKQGRIEFFSDKVTSDPPDLVAGHPKSQGHPTLPHLRNWIDCMRSRKRPRADVEIAHRSSTVCHLVNIARDLGRRLRWDPTKEAFVGDDQANHHPSVTRPRRKGYGLPSVI
jgi:predicted dehydrogenase